MDDYIDLKVSRKNLKLRVLIFVLAFLLATFSFSYGVYQLGKKDQGVYEIEANRNSDVSFYDSGIKMYYYLDDDSNQIKSNLESITNIYSNSLANIYCLLDNKNTYDNYENIASINQHLNQEIELDETLFNIILDAYKLTNENNGYSIFAGPIFESWEGILNSTSQLDYDPINNSFEKERLETIKELINDSNNISIDIIDNNKHIIKVNVSKQLINTLNKYEYQNGLIDLNLLKDSYIAKFLKDEFNKYNFTDGYLRFDSGLLINMSDRDFGNYILYSYDNNPVNIAEIKVENKICITCFKKFSLGEDNYYQVDLLFRSPFISSISGYPFDNLSSSYIYSFNYDPVKLVYDNIVLNQKGNNINNNYVYTVDNTVYTNTDILINKDFKVVKP